MKYRWATRLQLSVILVGTVWFAGCSGISSARFSTAPATLAYMLGANQTTILEYSLESSANATPAGVLTLPQFNYVNYPARLATDLTGQLYVASSSTTLPEMQVLVYPGNATGTATPLRTINISTDILALAVDPVGQLYVGSVGMGTNSTITVYSATSSGPALALRTIELPADETLVDVAADGAGNVYVAGYFSPSYRNWISHIDVYSPGASGAATPARSITVPLVIYGVAVDAAGDVFASLQTGTLETGDSTSEVIEEFAPGANGAGSPINTIQAFLPVAATEVEAGPVRVDGAGNIYTSAGPYNYSTDTYSKTIYRFAPNATGNAVPDVQITPRYTDIYNYSVQFGVN